MVESQPTLTQKNVEARGDRGGRRGSYRGKGDKGRGGLGDRGGFYAPVSQESSVMKEMF